jgi:hypothetical protein
MAGEMLADKIWPFYVVTWAVLAIASLLFNNYVSIETRRKWHGWMVGGSVGIIGIFMLVMSADWPTFPFVVLMVVPVISWMVWASYRRTRFCLSCNVTYGQGFFRPPPAYCPQCGQPTVGV